MEEQGRVRRGYFVAERGATQFALPGAEERLRTPAKDDDPPPPVVLAATDPASPWGALLPWPASTGRSPQRAPGARVLLEDGRLLGWLARGGHHVTTFATAALAEDAEALKQARLLARTLGSLPQREGRSLLLATVDGDPAPESPLAPYLAEVGFVARQGAMVKIPASSPRAFGRRPAHGAPAAESPPPLAEEIEEIDLDDDGLLFDFSAAPEGDVLDDTDLREGAALAEDLDA